MKIMRLAFFLPLVAGLALAPRGTHALTPSPKHLEFVRTLEGYAPFYLRSSLAEHQGRLLIGSSNRATLVDVPSGNVVRQFFVPTNGFFGNTVSAVGNTVAVGASTGPGRVYLFDATTGQLQHTLNGAENGDELGYSLAAGVSKIFAGAPERRSGFTYYGPGKVVAIDASGGRQTIANPEPGSLQFNEESFGFDLEASGDDLYVGALYDAEGGKVWQIDGATGATVREFSNPHGTLGNGNRPQFGVAVDVLGDYLLVGANQSSASGTDASGAAYLFNRSTGALMRTLFEPTPGLLNNFGIGVALIDKFAVITAYEDAPAPTFYSGLTYVFDITTGQVVQTIRTDGPAYAMRRIGNYLALGDSDDDGGVHIYAVVPEPVSGAVALACVGGMGVLLRRRCAKLGK